MILEVGPEHYKYLSIQHGSIASEENLADFNKWHVAYCTSIAGIYKSILPAIPLDGVESILDIGSGLGGIDIMLARHYNCVPEVCLLDGPNCPPHVFSHSLPFSDATVAKDFHEKNGNRKVCFYWPQPPVDKKFDLIVSFAAYCFHIAPFEYIGPLQHACHEKTTLIFDVRRDRKEWLQQLISAFGKPKVLARGEKWVRCAFRGR